MSVDVIYVACHKGDFRLARIAIASIRHWYPIIPIELIKDEYNGRFDTSELEQAFRVGIYQTDTKLLGCGYSKLQPLFEANRKKCILMDADIVFIGRVLERLDKRPEEFIVAMERPLDARTDYVRSTYYDFDGLKTLDPDFRWPGFVFNAGQYVATSGVLSRKDFSVFIDWTRRPRVIRPDIFKNNDQGILNYILARKAQQNELSLGGEDFMVWPGSPEFRNVNPGTIIRGLGYPQVVHWAGLRNPVVSRMIGGQILKFFENCYYRAVPRSVLRRQWRTISSIVFHYYLRSKQRFKNATGPTLKRVLRRWQRSP